MGEGIGYLGLGMVIGSAVAPGIGVTISENFGMRMTFLMSAVLTVAALVILCLFHEEKKENKEKKKIVFSDILAVEALPYTIVAGSYSFINGIIASYLVMYADELGISGVSVYFTVCAAVLFIVRPFSGKKRNSGHSTSRAGADSKFHVYSWKKHIINPDPYHRRAAFCRAGSCTAFFAGRMH